MMVLFQNKLIYLGYIPPGSRFEDFTPDKVPSGLRVSEETVWTSDKKQLKGFSVESKNPKESQGPVMIYFQGNAGNMIHRFDLFKTMIQAVPDLSMVGICYRGFGSSSGRATEKGLQRDASAIFKHVCDKYDKHRPIYLYGHSLGGAVALSLLASSSALDGNKNRIRGVILENTYTGIEQMVRALYPRYTPYPFIAKYFLWNRWPSMEKIAKVTCPILFLSSCKDEIVPPSHMQHLYDAASKSSFKELIQFPKATHMDMYQIESAAFKSAIKKFISSTSH